MIQRPRRTMDDLSKASPHAVRVSRPQPHTLVKIVCAES